MSRFLLMALAALFTLACSGPKPILPPMGKTYQGFARTLKDKPTPDVEILIETREGDLVVYLERGETKCLGTFKPTSGRDRFHQAYARKAAQHWELQFFKGHFTGNCRELAEAPRGKPRPLVLMAAQDAYFDFFELRICRTTGSCFDAYLTSDSLLPQN